MTKIVKEFEVGAEPDRVFALISVPEKWPQWGMSVKTASSNGSNTHWVYDWGGMKVESDTEVTEYQANRTYGFRQTHGFFKTAETLLDVRPGGKGSIVTWSVKFELPYSYLGKLVEKLQGRKKFEESMNESINKLSGLIGR